MGTWPDSILVRAVGLGLGITLDEAQCDGVTHWHDDDVATHHTRIQLPDKAAHQVDSPPFVAMLNSEHAEGGAWLQAAEGMYRDRHLATVQILGDPQSNDAFRSRLNCLASDHKRICCHV